MLQIDPNRPAAHKAGRLAQLLRVLLASALLAVVIPAAAFHFPWDQGHDTTSSNDPPPPGPDDRPPCDGDCNGGSTRSPVYAALGHAVWSHTDVLLRGRPALGVTRSYNSNDPVVGLFGNGWSVDFDVALYPANSSGVHQRVFKAANGKRFTYTQQTDGSFKAPDSRYESIVEGTNTVTMTFLDGRQMVFALDGRLLQRIDTNGNTISLGYDSTLRPVSIGDGNGRSLAIAYNGASLVASVTDHTGRAWRYAYDANANLVSMTDPAGGVTRYTWQTYRPPGDANIYSQLLSVTDAAGVVSVSYAYNGNQVASYTEGANRFTYTRSGSNTKLAGTVTRRDALGATTSFTYGALGLVTQDNDALGGITRYAYDSNGRLTQTTDALGRNWQASFDGLGRTTSTRNPLGNTVTVQYNATDPRPVGLTSASGRVVTMSYDARGNVVSSSDSAGATTQIIYGPKGDALSVTNAMGQRTLADYNAIGLPLRIVDALNRQTTMTYDPLGRLLSTTNPAGETSSFSYDTLDRLVASVDALGQTTSFSYNAAGRLLNTTDPKGSTTRFEYDGFGRRVAEVAPDGRRTTYAYRADNLLETLTWPDGTSISYQYDVNKRTVRQTAGSEVITYSYDALNQLTSASGPGGTVIYTYDAAGRIATETSGGRTQVSTRNAEGERIRLDALGQSYSYTRDARGLISRVGTPAGNFDFDFDPLGRRRQLGYPNGSTVSYAFDAAGQVTGVSHVGSFNAPYTHEYDPAGRITRTRGDGAEWNYTYDALGRLTRAARGSATFDYPLDPVGNRLDGGRIYDINHRLTGDSSKDYSYDARGNLLLESDRGTGARVAYTWNARNQLRQVDYFANAITTLPVRRIQYTYDPIGRRASKTDNGAAQNFVYDGDDLVAVLDASGGVVFSNVFSGAIDEPLSTTSGGSTKLLHTNLLGSVVAVAEGNAVTSTYSYGPFGETLAPSSADSLPFRFTGREKDTDELYYFRARYYHTGLGRFISADPIGLAGGLSLYAYAGGNPVSVGDPQGTQPGSPDWCRRQAERIRNIENKIQERIGELDEDPQGLPEACPGDDLKPSLSRRGHRKLINMDKANLAAQKALYAAYCGGGGPPPVPVPVPNPAPQPAPQNNSPFSLEYWEALTGLTGAALIAYLVVSEGSRLFPPRNLVPVP